MARITFDRLLAIYQHTTFSGDAAETGDLLIANQSILDTLFAIEDDDDAAADAAVAALVERSQLAVGRTVPVQVSPPRIGLGRLARDLDHLLLGPGARVAEPARFFVISGQYHHQTTPPPSELEKYRAVLRLVGLLAEAAAFLDKEKQELVFIRKGRFSIPVEYNALHVNDVALADVDALAAKFTDDAHRDQKLGILAEAVAELTSALPAKKRFSALLVDLPALLRKVSDGYKLFASSFSYEKIRGEMEAARVEYLNKIHKTFSDIQGQILGIPVATVVVATQLAVATTCGKEFWGNTAVLIGAWIFLALLAAAIINQWLTLGAIEDEIGRQRRKMHEQYAAIESRFTDIFSSLNVRVWWHRAILVGTTSIALLGLVLAHIAYSALTQVSPLTCAIGLLTSN